MAITDEIPKSRITLTYRTEVHGEREDVALPFRVLVMGDGELIEDAKPADLFNSPKDPRTKALIDRYRSGEQ